MISVDNFIKMSYGPLNLINSRSGLQYLTFCKVEYQFQRRFHIFSPMLNFWPLTFRWPWDMADLKCPTQWKYGVTLAPWYNTILVNIGCILNLQYHFIFRLPHICALFLTSVHFNMSSVFTSYLHSWPPGICTTCIFWD